MGSKRGANTELTDRNWDREDEAEEAGRFQPADEAKLKTRVIRTAKRRGNGTTSNSSSSAFSGFGGFGAAASSTTQPSFNFGGAESSPKPASATPTFNFGLSSAVSEKSSVEESSAKTTTTMPTFNLGTTTSSPAKPKTVDFNFGVKTTAKPESSVNGAASSSLSAPVDDAAKRAKYLTHVKALNASVLAWIQKHLTESESCVLSPVFADYDRHFQSIRDKFGVKKGKTEVETEQGKTSPIPKPSSYTPPFSFNAKPTESKPASTPPTYGLFGSAAEKTGNGEAASFKFGSATTSTAGSFGLGQTAPAFSFGKTSGAATPFSFGSGNLTTTNAPSNASNGSGGATAAGDEDYVPPKPDVKEVNEDDAVYTKRCKLFYKKDAAFVDRGVGNLFIKPMGGSKDKFSLLVRADTNLGNVLLNIAIKDISFKAMGGKDVTFLCVPNPPPDPKMPADAACVVLLRLKDAATRDEALEQLNQHA